MSERYLPESEFLNYVLDEEISFDETPLGAANLQQLLRFVHDPDRSNRDWASFFIAQLDLDTPDIRAALLHAAKDTDADARDEALVGLARRDRDAALQLILPELEDGAGTVLLEAAKIIADPSLLPLLRPLELSESGDEHVRGLLREAIAACEVGEWTYMGTA